MPASKATKLTPTEIARETLIKLAGQKLAPTPENFRRIYDSISGTGSHSEGIEKLPAMLLSALEIYTSPQAQKNLTRLRQCIEQAQWEQLPDLLIKHFTLQQEQTDSTKNWGILLHDLIIQWELRQAGLSQRHKQETLERVLYNYGKQGDVLYDKLRGLLDNWGTPTAQPSIRPTSEDNSEGTTTTTTKPIPPADVPAGTQEPGIADHPSWSIWRNTLDNTLHFGVAPRLVAYPELWQELYTLQTSLAHVDSEQELDLTARRLKHFWVRTELNLQQEGRLVVGLVSILQLLLDNLVELLSADHPIRGQLTAVRTLLDGMISMRTIYQVEASLKEVVYRQGLLKHSLDEATLSMRAMVGSFIERLSLMANETGSYQERLEDYTERIEESQDPLALGEIISSLMMDTRHIQHDLVTTRDELMATRGQAESAQAQIKALEQALEEASAKVKEDQLTGAYNRRGLEELFLREIDRATRTHNALSAALIDVDNFKQLNDRYGHLVGDDALKHLVNLVRERARPTDIVARFGGEEFVVVMPDTNAEQGVLTIERLQRELTKTLFLANKDRLVITFSAGVAQWREEESVQDTIERADHAMYDAKLAGKNRVFSAETPADDQTEAL